MDCKYIFEKIIIYSKRTWGEIRKDTYGYHNKTCHHYLSYEKLSIEAKERIAVLGLENYVECIYSIRLEGKIRIIGIRDKEKFFVKWYDPMHEFCPSSK